MSIEILDRTGIQFKVLADLCNAAANLVPLHHRARVHVGVAWGKYTHGSCGVKKVDAEKKHRSAVIRLHIRHPKRCRRWEAAEAALGVFVVLLRKLHRAEEYHTGKMPWPHILREIQEISGARSPAARVLAEGCFARKLTNRFKAQAAIMSLADEFLKIGAIA